MGSELYAAGKSQIAVTLTPGQAGVFRVTLNGEVAFDKGELGRYPALPDAKELKAQVSNMIEAVTV
jgi:predicted Rdx family selenoprotein